MSRGMKHLRASVLGLAVSASLGFGVSQALAAPTRAAPQRVACTPLGYDYYDAGCASRCTLHQGYCSESGVCRCGQIP